MELRGVLARGVKKQGVGEPMKKTPGFLMVGFALLAGCGDSRDTELQDESSTAAEYTGGCGYDVRALVDGSGFVVGQVEVIADGDLLLSFETAAGYRLWSVKSTASANGLPLDADGALSASWFPHQVILGDESHSASAYPTRYELVIPQGELAAQSECAELAIAAQVTVKLWNEAGGFVGSSRAWGEGALSFVDLNRPDQPGSGFRFELCCE
jgi:hypothetical protein